MRELPKALWTVCWYDIASLNFVRIGSIAHIIAHTDFSFIPLYLFLILHYPGYVIIDWGYVSNQRLFWLMGSNTYIWSLKHYYLFCQLKLSRTVWNLPLLWYLPTSANSAKLCFMKFEAILLWALRFSITFLSCMRNLVVAHNSLLFIVLKAFYFWDVYGSLFFFL